MGDSILYLDSRHSRAVTRALRRHGTVEHARDINQALILMAENDFDYYFVDADTPQAQAFVRHLRHDPTLAPPSGVVLLTGNDEEDCRAWSVDTFINRGRVHRDAQRVFSLGGQEGPDESNVLRIGGRLEARREAAGSEGEPAGNVKRAPGSEPADRAFELRKRTAGRGDTRLSYAGGTNRTYRYAVVTLLITALGLWLFTWGPLARDKGRVRRRAASQKVEAESKNKKRKSDPLGLLLSVPFDYAAGTAPAAASAPQAGAAPLVTAEEPATAEKPAASKQPVENGQAVPAEQPASSEPEAAAPAPSTSSAQTAAVPPPAPAANRSPTVNISGPTRVMARQAATYSASGSDPDGDAITYSWGSSTTTRCWSTPGLYSVTVTVTDGRGESASASVSVRVI